jgi:N-acetyl-alpha-D-muramate 1-phosphate uridylyltransferase
MRAMILAAGRGTRMGDLTNDIPKPLLKVNGQYLIEYSLHALAKASVSEVVINVCYRKEMIKEALGDGERYGLTIQYSDEDEALETGGGIVKALPRLGKEPFIVISSDIVSDYPLQNLPKEPLGLAHLILIDNPSYHPGGDFCLYGHRIYYGKGETLTFGNIGVYRPELFAGCSVRKFPLVELFKREIANQKIDGEHYKGSWFNIGSPDQLVAAIELGSAEL